MTLSKNLVASVIHEIDLIMQATCVYQTTKVTGVTHTVELYKNTTVTCDPSGKFAIFTLRLPRSLNTNYACYFEDALGSTEAVSSVTVLESDSE